MTQRGGVVDKLSRSAGDWQHACLFEFPPVEFPTVEVPEALGEEDNDGFPADVAEDFRFGHGGFGFLLFQC